MNTVDRSIEALDTALRRRFSFVPMHPRPEELDNKDYKCEGIDLSSMLETINTRIEKLLDRDHRIGHSYFMGIKNRDEPLQELKVIFINKILPLLQEYFYYDWGKIGLVLGNGFVTKVDTNKVSFADFDFNEDYDEFIEKPIYKFTDPDTWTLDTFIGIYEQKKG